MLFLCVYKNRDVNEKQIGLYDAKDELEAQKLMAEDLIPLPDIMQDNCREEFEKRNDEVRKMRQFVTAKGVNDGSISI